MLVNQADVRKSWSYRSCEDAAVFGDEKLQEGNKFQRLALLLALLGCMISEMSRCFIEDRFLVTDFCLISF